MNETELAAQAVEFVKKNKKQFISHVIDQYVGDTGDRPVAIFMAGTPGAGKTEIAKSLLALFEYIPVRIDADEFRDLIPGYTGANSEIVQGAASLAVEKAMDAVIDKQIPFILDATFAIGKATANIKRAYRHEYETQICFVYQDPISAWEFTKRREKKEGRRVPKDVFINAYFASRENVKAVKKEFGDKILLRVIIKNYTTNTHKTYDNVQDIEAILPKLYNKDELGEMLHD
jgi:predicted ABC-type ATPase